MNYSPSKYNPHEVINPEISKAYYSKLTGEPHYYRIKSDKQFLFYTGILSPKVNDTYQWLSLDVLDENDNVIYQAEGSNFNWNDYTDRKKEWKQWKHLW